MARPPVVSKHLLRLHVPHASRPRPLAGLWTGGSGCVAILLPGRFGALGLGLDPVALEQCNCSVYVRVLGVLPVLRVTCAVAWFVVTYGCCRSN